MVSGLFHLSVKPILINIKKPLAEIMKLSFDEVNRGLGSSQIVDGQQVNFFDRSDKNGNLYGIFDVLKSFKCEEPSGSCCRQDLMRSSCSPLKAWTPPARFGNQ